MQQMKELGKNPPDQINEEIGSLPEKEFRVMLIKMIQKKKKKGKMIQNLRNKMEAQIYRMEAWIQKIQEVFNKDLEEIKNNQ